MSDGSKVINESIRKLSVLLGGESFHGFRSEVWSLFAHVLNDGVESQSAEIDQLQKDFNTTWEALMGLEKRFTKAEDMLAEIILEYRYSGVANKTPWKLAKVLAKAEALTELDKPCGTCGGKGYNLGVDKKLWIPKRIPCSDCGDKP